MTHVLEVDGVELEIDPQVGGRITSFRHGDFEVLSSSAIDANNYGSTFWTSPQSDWGWPPPAEIDRGPYTIESHAGDLTLTGPPSDLLGVKVSKRFTVDRTRRAIVIEYTLENVSRAPRTYAPWEVTRVQARGLTFFPTSFPIAPSSCSGKLALDERDDAVWYAHVPEPLPPDGLKAMVRGTAGMLAHVAGGYLFVKRFEPVPPEKQAPGEGSIEVYANPRYVELEVQGRYSRIEPGAKATWSVVWSLRKLPSGIAAAAGSGGLLAFAHAMGA
ncbi:MAG: DUF4380 domain-containing protein [Myxococcota bacterium]|nr:DUF4380 domain-containing protein [Myxococcota bacterium]